MMYAIVKKVVRPALTSVVNLVLRISDSCHIHQYWTSAFRTRDADMTTALKAEDAPER